jgi:exodeoxyribonuclease V alpha subunit
MAMAHSASKTPPPCEKLSGIIERVTFHNPENGFCVLKLLVKQKVQAITVVGNLIVANAGESIEVEGHWVWDSQHGRQFTASHIRLLLPTHVVGIEKYLGSGMIKGIGPHFAKKLVAAFGENTLTVIEQTPEKLLTLSGIGRKRQQQLLSGWQAQKAIRDIMIFLQSYQISSARAVRIYKTYGEQAIAKIQENPYRLAQEVYGFGFKTADALAKQMAIPEDSPLRATAGVRYVMQQLAEGGDCAVLLATLQTHAQALLALSETLIDAAIEQAITGGQLIKTQFGGETQLALTSLYQAEVSVAQQLYQLYHRQCTPWSALSLEAALSQLATQANVTLSASQQAAILQALRSKVFIITGGPGVGKTTVIKSLLTLLKHHHPGLQILLAAPTGRAAKRLSEATGWPAKTIHRLLAFDPKSFGFKHHRDYPLPVDLLIVDEVSMLDVVLMNQLLKALPETAALWLVGDVDQLPSVGPGRVLADLIESEQLPVARLTEIFRQAARSRIIVNAHRINQGKAPLPAPPDSLSDFYFIEADTPEVIQAKLLELVSVRIPQRFKVDPIKEIQVLTPMNRGSIGAQILNNLLRDRLNGQAAPQITRFGQPFALGDKVIQRVNNYDKLIFNGDIGYIQAVDVEAGSLQIDFEGQPVEYSLNELDELSLAYAMSIHKSQGSEYPVVVMPIAMQHYRLLARNLLYTGITRAKQLVVLIGQKRALHIAIQTISNQLRLTQLQPRLQEVFVKGLPG